jgi:hypothetical protein
MESSRWQKIAAMPDQEFERGYRRSWSLVPDAAEQAQIQRMVAMRRNGKTLRAIQAALEAKGHKLTVPGVAKVLETAEARTGSARPRGADQLRREFRERRGG